MKRIYPIVATAAVMAIVYSLSRIFVHSSALLTPAVITPQMNAHSMIAPALDARVQRLMLEMQPRKEESTQRLIALTFDDGPYAVDTPLLLDQLKDLNVPATFFLIGRDAEEQPELTARIIAEGFEVGDHTRSHPNLDELGPTDVDAELLAGTGILQRFTNSKSPRIYFRPPHGRYTEQTITIAQNLGYTTVLWNDDAGDWKIDDPQVLVKHIEEHAMSPEILLLHSGRIATSKMLSQIVPAFRLAGYRFVTISNLFKEVAPDDVNHAHRFNVEHYLVAHPTSLDSPTEQ